MWKGTWFALRVAMRLAFWQDGFDRGFEMHFQWGKVGFQFCKRVRDELSFCLFKNKRMAHEQNNLFVRDQEQNNRLGTK